MALIPLTNNASSIFNIDLNGIEYTLKTKFNYRFGYWTLDILLNDEPVFMGLGMLIGSNIIGQFPRGNEIGALFMIDTSDTRLDATFSDLGTRVVLMYLTPEEIVEVGTILEIEAGE